MKSYNKNIFNELTRRVVCKIADEQVTSLFIERKPLMNITEIVNYLEENINSYLSMDELEQLVNTHSLFGHIDEPREIIIKIFIVELAVNVISTINIALKDKDFVGDNPFDPLKNPYAFMIYKFYNEKLGVKFNFIDSDIIAPFQQ